MAERRVTQSLTKPIDQTTDKPFCGILTGENFIQCGAAFQPQPATEGFELVQSLRYTSIGTPAFDSFLHCRLGLALRSAIAPQRRDCGMNTHCRSP